MNDHECAAAGKQKVQERVVWRMDSSLPAMWLLAS
jgi:hypothetical protein